MKRIVTRTLAGSLFAVFLSLAPAAGVRAENRVDFRYALPWWQSAICLPDDPDKIIVGKEGQVLLDFGSAGFRNFAICLQPDVAGGAAWVRQQTMSPRAPVMQTWKDAAGVEIREETFVVTPKTGPSQPQAGSARRIVMLVSLKNTTNARVSCRPILHIQSVAAAIFSAKDQVATVAPETRITASDRIEKCEARSNKDCTLLLTPLTLAPGASQQVAFTVDRRCSKPEPTATVATACTLRDAARRWWETSDLPFETILIPDGGIQAMIESCVRNIWQAREIKRGKPAFHVGPTVYRNLWVVDGSFLLESAALLNRAKDARAGIEYMLSHQKPDGSFELLKHFWKENGIVLWAVTRHAFLTRDKPWLRSQWPALQRVVQVIENMRVQTSRDPQALDYGLLPGGDVDGGISSTAGEPEFSNTYWCLTGLKAAVAAAHWLGDESNAMAWQKEYDAFYAAFRKAAARDTLKDQWGNAYVPTMMGDARRLTPQKGQWAFCHAVYPGQIFPVDDPLAAGQMAMLRATKVEGMVFDTGWMNEGLWTYFASFYGHATLWMGRGDEAAQVLYDFANHAAPTRVWREEQKPLGKGVQEVGDMPHNWASAEFIRLATHLLELDRGDELHLLEGLPVEWLKAGMTTRLDGLLTPFGPLHMTLRVDRQGKIATLKVEPLEANCRNVVVHLPDGTLRRLTPSQGGTLTFDLSKRRNIVQPSPQGP